MKTTFYVLILVGMGAFGNSALAAPVTQVKTFHPATQTEVSRPATSVVVARPGQTAVTQLSTSVAVSQQTTSTAVSKPATAVAVTKPATTVQVSRPATSVVGGHPGETDWRTETGRYGNRVSSVENAADTGKKVASSSSKATSMMSSYQPPQAKDLKAAQLGSGTEGLGNKINEAEKDAAAAALNIPKGEEVSLENVMKSTGNTGNLKQKIEKKL